MPIEFVSGDLFANRFRAHALAHGCNCQGSMGAGVATGFRDRHPPFSGGSRASAVPPEGPPPLRP
jgi:O-acetyl-ADP-ribose deacetylase (regulator of RNase III)